MEIVFLV